MATNEDKGCWDELLTDEGSGGGEDDGHDDDDNGDGDDKQEEEDEGSCNDPLIPLTMHQNLPTKHYWPLP